MEAPNCELNQQQIFGKMAFKAALGCLMDPRTIENIIALVYDCAGCTVGICLPRVRDEKDAFYFVLSSDKSVEVFDIDGLLAQIKSRLSCVDVVVLDKKCYEITDFRKKFGELIELSTHNIQKIQRFLIYHYPRYFGSSPRGYRFLSWPQAPIPERIRDIIIANSPDVTELSLTYGDLDSDDMDLFRQLMRYNTHITALDLTGSNIAEEGAKELARIKTLLSINLTRNYIGDEGVKEILKNENLTFLDLSRNRITNLGAELLLQRVQKTGLKVVLEVDPGAIDLELHSKITGESVSSLETELLEREIDNCVRFKPKPRSYCSLM